MLIPLKVDVHMPRMPWVNCALILVICAVSISAMVHPDVLLDLAGIKKVVREVSMSKLTDAEWQEHAPTGFDLVDTMSEEGAGAVLERAGGYGTVTVTDYKFSPEKYGLATLALTSTFLHEPYFFHLFGNMLFLWVFGNAMNYKLGHSGYAMVYLLSAFCGSMAQYAASPNTPVMGASGAVFGVMGAFLVFFPRNNVSMMLLILFRPFIFTVSSFWAIGGWIFWTLLMALMGAGALTQIGYAAHAGGFAAGFGVALVLALCGVVKSTSDEQTLVDVVLRKKQMA